ncbi:MAG: DUF3794 domain-containing protein [Clostridia bacterium]|nr:DUF3794 domain-containing protein [Clostridia bacterium]
MSKPTSTQIRFPARIWDTILDKETEFDGALPDYCPDIVRLIRVDCTPYTDSCQVIDNKVQIGGRVIYDILYETDHRNKLRFCSFTQEFRHTADLPKTDADSPEAHCKVSCSKITCRMLSPRRPALRARLELHTTVSGSIAVNALSVQQTGELFFAKKTLCYDVPDETLRREFRFEESLPLLQGEESIGEMIYGTVTVQPPQTTVTKGSILAKTTASVKVLYQPEDLTQGSNYRMAVKNLPLTLALEAPDAEDGKHCSLQLEVGAQSVIPELDQYGESRLLKANFTVNAVARTMGKAEIEVAEDLFARNAVVTACRTEFSLPRVASTADRSFTVDLKLPTEEPIFTALYDTTVRAGRVKASPAEGGVELTGTLTVSVLGDSMEGVLHRDHTSEFVQFIPAELPVGLTEITAEAMPFEIMPTLHSDGSISARVICNASLTCRSAETMSFLSEPVKQADPPEEEPYSVAYFYPAKTDTLWSVAKKYRIDPARLKADNPTSFDESGRLLPGTRTITVINQAV